MMAKHPLAKVRGAALIESPFASGIARPEESGVAGLSNESDEITPLCPCNQRRPRVVVESHFFAFLAKRVLSRLRDYRSALPRWRWSAIDSGDSREIEPRDAIPETRSSAR